MCYKLILTKFITPKYTRKVAKMVYLHLSVTQKTSHEKINFVKFINMLNFCGAPHFQGLV
jgi:hypothetical protein